MMRRWWVLAMSAVVVGCAGQVQSANTGLRYPSDAAAIKAVFDTTTAGWNRGELAAYLSAYTNSATAMGSNGPERGVNAIGDQMRAGYWKAGRPAQQLHYEHLEIRPLGPDQALATGQYVLSGGGRPDRTGWFTTIWLRTPDGWRMVHDHSS
ncbi:MAG: nuclear transport factor 2 family protein [Gemmatimonadales bacterium]